MQNTKKIRDENNRLSKNLNKENQMIYTDIVCYLRVSNLSDIEQEEVSEDILSMFFDWEKQGKDAKVMLGNDYKQFVDGIIDAVNPHKTVLQKSKELLFIVIDALGFLLTIDFIILYLPKIIKGNFSLVYDYSLSMAVRAVLITIFAICVVKYIGKNSFYLSKTSKPVRFLIGCCAGAFIVLLVYLSKICGNIVLMSINIKYIVAIIVVFWLYTGIRSILKRKSGSNV